MTTDIKLDPSTHDLIINEETSDIELFSNKEELIRQRIKINLLSYREDWFLDINYGIPYLQEIFDRSKDTVLADFYIKDTITNTEGVISITNYTTAFEGQNYKVSFSARVDSGSVITSTQILGG